MKPRLIIPVTPEQHQQIKCKAVKAGLTITDVGRRLFFAWLRNDLPLPPEKQGHWKGEGVEHWNKDDDEDRPPSM